MGRRWIIKNIFKIHPFYYLCFIICSFTGHLKDYLLFSLIIIVHELGHITLSLFFKWNIEKVILLPFGGITIFNEDINRPLKEEGLILIFGPLTQIVFSLFLDDKCTYYSSVILLFNLLPIYPLDGSKFVNLFLNKFISFKKSHIVTIYISFITILFVIYKSSFNLILILTMIFIFFKVMEEYKNHSMIFNRFLYERYRKNYGFKKIKYVKSIYNMKRDCFHYIKSEKGYLTERNVLKKRFDFKRKTW